MDEALFRAWVNMIMLMPHTAYFVGWTKFNPWGVW